MNYSISLNKFQKSRMLQASKTYKPILTDNKKVATLFLTKRKSDVGNIVRGASE